MAERKGIQQRDAAFQNRMRDNQRNFEARQRAITGTNEAINRMSMEGYRNRNAMIYRGQDATINAIHEENTVQNPFDGTSYQVESGAEQYWMNANGEYIPSNDVLYDPNTDPDINQSEWQRVNPE
jgi:hypothetical protein